MFFIQVMVDKSGQVDEITNHINASWYGDTNSLWRLFEFPLNKMSPSVQKLAIHLPDQQPVVFNPSRIQTEEQLQQVMEGQERTTLTAFFELNREDPDARQHLYCDILRYYSWVPHDQKTGKKKFFKKRTYRSGIGEELGPGESTQIGRIPVVIPGRPEREELYYLR